jgi:hypothetical protein
MRARRPFGLMLPAVRAGGAGCGACLHELVPHPPVELGEEGDHFAHFRLRARRYEGNVFVAHLFRKIAVERVAQRRGATGRVPARLRRRGEHR